jgi:antitoxin component of MazEF toxin-antitoxin module
MERQLNVVKWGNGFGLRLPRVLLSELEAKGGDLFDVEVSPGTLVLRAREAEPVHRPSDDGTAPPLDFEALQRKLQNIVDEAGSLAALLDRGAF